MVTYLVCFVIGDYKYLETFTNKGTRVSTSKDLGNGIAFGLCVVVISK